MSSCGDDHGSLRCIMRGGARRWMDEHGRVFLELQLDDGRPPLNILLTNASYTEGRDLLLAAITGRAA